MNEMTPATRMTAKDFDQELLELYDYYAHGKITKREFLDRALKAKRDGGKMPEAPREAEKGGH